METILRSLPAAANVVWVSRIEFVKDRAQTLGFLEKLRKAGVKEESDFYRQQITKDGTKPELTKIPPAHLGNGAIRITTSPTLIQAEMSSSAPMTSLADRGRFPIRPDTTAIFMRVEKCSNSLGSFGTRPTKNDLRAESMTTCTRVFVRMQRVAREAMCGDAGHSSCLQSQILHVVRVGKIRES